MPSCTQKPRKPGPSSGPPPRCSPSGGAKTFHFVLARTSTVTGAASSSVSILQERRVPTRGATAGQVLTCTGLSSASGLGVRGPTTTRGGRTGTASTLIRAVGVAITAASPTLGAVSCSASYAGPSRPCGPTGLSAVTTAVDAAAGVRLVALGLSGAATSIACPLTAVAGLERAATRVPDASIISATATSTLAVAARRTVVASCPRVVALVAAIDA